MLFDESIIDPDENSSIKRLHGKGLKSPLGIE